MKESVRIKLESVLKYPFFRDNGKALPPSVLAVTGWKRAVASHDSRKWSDACLAARNVLFDFVQVHAWARGQEWGPLANELRPIIVSFVDDLLKRTQIPAELTKHVHSRLSWDIMLICFEEEYKDVIAPFFYIPLLDPWYSSGHLPCGWTGYEFPERWDGVIRGGQLMVF